jgi:hypothetical protein
LASNYCRLRASDVQWLRGQYLRSTKCRLRPMSIVFRQQFPYVLNRSDPFPKSPTEENRVKSSQNNDHYIWYINTNVKSILKLNKTNYFLLNTRKVRFHEISVAITLNWVKDSTVSFRELHVFIPLTAKLEIHIISLII